MSTHWRKFIKASSVRITRISRMGMISAMLAVGVVLVGPLRAELVWENVVEQVRAEPGQRAAKVSFRFRNAGKDVVEIGKIRTSCGCTTAQLEKKIYQPDEEGRVDVTFTFGNRKGRQEKTVIVEMSDKAKPRQVLRLVADLPDTVAINKKLLNWQIGDPLESQSVEVRGAEGASAQVVDVQSLSPDFLVDLKKGVSPADAYQIAVTPVSTRRTSRAMVRVTVADPDRRSIYVVAQVRD